MTDSSFVQIIEQCLKMEGIAIKVYSQMAGNTTGELQAFWLDMSEQEKVHAKYWQLLIRLAREKKIRNVFDAPLRILDELSAAAKKAEMLSGNHQSDDVQDDFITAYRLEFVLLHPAFQALFILMKHAAGGQSPGDDYHHHIQGLINAYRKYVKRQPSVELIADLSEKLLQRNEQIAAQMAELTQIRGLLPICMHCKNIRNDDGFWVKVEHYVEEHSDAEFSHGICPDCMKKYYSEFFTEEELNE
ncbi:hypothetical protein JW835_12040 [bacterium]|nr:hypothetical protein [bacterium]